MQKFRLLSLHLFICFLVCYAQYWMDSRYYEHHYYDIVRRPLQEVFSSFLPSIESRR
ncbi:hypothetical protein DAI22_11g145800 [Oryza sativa Japonica Group]|nr:hypothetical protein DAI22_11g145800 [Oryza sativa Japonica Group]